MKLTVIPIVIDTLGIVTKGFDTGTGRLENKRISRYYLNYGIDEIGQNTEKSPGN